MLSPRLTRELDHRQLPFLSLSKDLYGDMFGSSSSVYSFGRNFTGGIFSLQSTTQNWVSPLCLIYFLSSWSSSCPSCGEICIFFAFLGSRREDYTIFEMARFLRGSTFKGERLAKTFLYCLFSLSEDISFGLWFTGLMSGQLLIMLILSFISFRFIGSKTIFFRE